MTATRNMARKYGAKAVAGVGSFAAVAAQAALDTGTSAAMASAKTDTTELAGLSFAIVLGIAVFKWFRRAL